jgi:hypothetical protein
MDANTIATILTTILAIASTLIGAKYSQGKTAAENKAIQVQTVLKDVIALSEKTVEAGMDNAVTEEEYKGIAEALQKTVTDAKTILN